MTETLPETCEQDSDLDSHEPIQNGHKNEDTSIQSNENGDQSSKTEVIDAAKPVPKSKPKVSPQTSKKFLDCEFPSTLEEFQYKFDEKGVLRSTESDEGFVFAVRKNHEYNQRRYEALGDIITEEIYSLMETDCDLERHYVPIDAVETDARSFIFASKDFDSNTDCLLVLIHGAGVVRAGQWARSIIINKSINEGSQIPYIEEAKSKGWAVIVFNTNLNMATKTLEDGNQTFDYVDGSGTPEEHAQYVWDNFITKKSKASNILIVAHSFGGVVTAHLAEKREDFVDRVTAVALTDSVHALRHMDASRDVEKFYEDRVINWVAAPTPVNTPISSRLFSGKDCKLRSAGSTKHEMTSHCAKQSIFEWFDQMLSDAADDSVATAGLSSYQTEEGNKKNADESRPESKPTTTTSEAQKEPESMDIDDSNP